MHHSYFSVPCMIYTYTTSLDQSLQMVSLSDQIKKVNGHTLVVNFELL
jgi:hypothetical protein